MPFIKVCGLRDPTNLPAIAALLPDAVGLIFSEPSPRFAGALPPIVMRALPPAVRRVGVFVDATLADIEATAEAYGLDAVQLHGSESPEICAAVGANGRAVVKAIRVDDAFDLAALAPYVPHVQGFLFDAPGPRPGGNGVAFDWQRLADYPYAATTPWLLAGGLTPGHLPALQALWQTGLPGLAGFDLNSGFETVPGWKDVAAVRDFLLAWAGDTAPTDWLSTRTSHAAGLVTG